ncbi:MAG: hypothetical protein J6S43_02690 [Lentisphaeria bacterium]|nr:hypothetical protein [Lentisphaeria bacterium]
MFDIQKEIDLCAASGGGEVTIPPGTWHCGTIFLRSNVRVILSAGTVICGSPRLEDYPAVNDSFSDGTAQERGRALILGVDIHDAAFCGDGTISGSGEAFKADDPAFGMRPILIRFANCRNIALSGVHLRDSAAWTCHLRNCENVTINDLDIFCHANSNNDGIDIDSCRQVKVADCRIDTGDDAVCLKSTASTPCENITVSGCELRSRAAAFKVGTETYGDIRQVKFTGCRIMRGDMGAIKIFSADGAKVENFEISGITVTEAANPLFIRLGRRGRTYDGSPVKPVGYIRNISVSDLHADISCHKEAVRSMNYPQGVPLYAHNCLAIMGQPDIPVENISLRDISLNLPGGMNETPAAAEVPEFASGYPEIGYYGVLPACGVYMRHVKDVDFSGVDISLTTPDRRQKIVLENSLNVNGI